MSRLGALKEWHRELAAGENGQVAGRPDTWNIRDPLYRAACCEAQAEDARRAGLPETAHAWLERGAEIIREAARTRRVTR